jgi:uncharacterized protein (DUF427 family)
MTRLEPSDSRTVCAYKGQAGYYSVAGGGPDGRDIAWTYRDPLHDALHVRDHICFYNERVDLTLDDVTLPRPRTPWSSPPDQSRS